jgi:hypothetical protein
VSWDSDALRKPSHVSYINVGGNFEQIMRVSITFFLVVSILVLTYWGWALTPSRIEYHPLVGSHSKYEDVKRILNSTDVEFLREQAIDRKVGEEALERDRDTFKAMIILGASLLLTVATLVLLFLEIAARGRNYRQHKL